MASPATSSSRRRLWRSRAAFPFRDVRFMKNNTQNRHGREGGHPGNSRIEAAVAANTIQFYPLFAKLTAWLL